MGDYGFPVCSSSNAHAQPTMWAFLPEASSRSLLHVYEQQRLWRTTKALANSKGSGETALMHRLT